jgi:hypothetical protein
MIDFKTGREKYLCCYAIAIVLELMRRDEATAAIAERLGSTEEQELKDFLSEMDPDEIEMVQQDAREMVSNFLSYVAPRAEGWD